MIDWADEAFPRSHHSGVSGYDALFKQARQGKHAEIIERLQQEPTLLNVITEGHNRSLAWEAARGGNVALLEILIDKNATLDAPGRIRSQIQVLLSPLAIAMRYKKTDVVARLQGTGQQLTFYEHCYFGHRDNVAIALKKRPSLLRAVNSHDTVWKVTGMHYAVAGGQLAIIEQLGQAGAMVEPYSRLLLNIASRQKNPALLQALQQYGVNSELIPAWYKTQV